MKGPARCSCAIVLGFPRALSWCDNLEASSCLLQIAVYSINKHPACCNIGFPICALRRKVTTTQCLGKTEDVWCRLLVWCAKLQAILMLEDMSLIHATWIAEMIWFLEGQRKFNGICNDGFGKNSPLQLAAVSEEHSHQVRTRHRWLW